MAAIPVLYALGNRKTAANNEWQVLEVIGAMALSLILNIVTLPALIFISWRSRKQPSLAGTAETAAEIRSLPPIPIDPHQSGLFASTSPRCRSFSCQFRSVRTS